MIKAATLRPGSYASYVCHDTTGQTGVLGVVAYVKPSDGNIKILEGVKPTLELCEAMGKTALATKVVPGACLGCAITCRAFDDRKGSPH
jgi:hypothetical protein